MPRKSTRREFLKGRAAADAVYDFTSGVASVPAPASALPERGEATLLQIGREAMACEFEVVLRGDAHASTETALAALDVVDELEDQLTVYRPHSEVVRLNQAAAIREVLVERGLFQLLQLANEIHAATGGAFDATAGPLAKTWGFFRRQGRMPGDEEIAEALARVGSEDLVLDAERQTVRFGRMGMEINLGGIGKGYALDRAAALLEERGVKDFLFHGGQSSLLARGARSKAEGSAGWTIGLGHPLRPGTRLAEIDLVNRACGTSGGGAQFFYHEGRKYSHILDPRSGRPAEGVYSATVVAPTAAEADAWATAAFVLGPQEAVPLLEARPGFALLLIAPGKHSGRFEVHQTGFAEGECRILSE